MNHYNFKINFSRTKKTQKLYVLSLIFILSFITIADVIKPAQATTWTDITLPYTITEAGNYRITAPYVGTNTGGLVIEASNVVVDGQNYAVSLEANQTLVQASNQTNILLQNINVTASANGYSWVGFDFLACTNFTVQNSNVANTSYYGMQLLNCSDFNILNCNIADGSNEGIRVYSCDNFDLNNSNITNCGSDGLSQYLCSYFRVTDCNLNGNYEGIYTENSTSFNITGCNAISNYEHNIFLYKSNNFHISSSNASETQHNNGLFIYECNNFSVTDTYLLNNNWNGFSAYLCNNYSLQNVTSTGNSQDGFWGGNGSDILVENSDFSYNLQGVYANYLNGTRFSGNAFRHNGLNKGAYWGGFEAYNSNCTVEGNYFSSNYDAIIFEADNETIPHTQTFANNVFHNNTYTFLFAYELPSSRNDVKIVFTNNLVNDTTNVDPAGFNATFSGPYLPFNHDLLSLNGTVQLGGRPYSNGPLVSGNFWAKPDGSGFSQTGTDADKDGFVDSAFELFNDTDVGLAYDYHPYSLGFDINTWVSVNLPAVITQPGNYLVASSWSGNQTAITIQADNVTVDGQNCLIKGEGNDGDIGESFGVIIASASNVTLRNINVANSSFGVGSSAENYTITDCSFNYCFAGLYAIGGGPITLTNVVMNNNSVVGALILSADNCNIRNSTFSNNNLVGLYLLDSDNSTIQNCTLSNNPELSGMEIAECSNLKVKNCSLNNNGIDGLTILDSINFEFSNLTLKGNGLGAEIFGVANGTVQQCLIQGNNQGVYCESIDNVTFTANTFSDNGLVKGVYCGGFKVMDSNCTVANNLFENNFDALIWTAANNDTTNTLVHDNIFHNNTYTFFFDNQVYSGFTGQKLYFYNNMVNDTAYVDPVCLNNTYSGLNLPLSNIILNLNTTMQSGTRIFGNPSRIGGNFWAYPNGTGPSQTGVDANHDGFVDSAFDIFGSFNDSSLGAVCDYLPYSQSYTTSLVFTVGASQSLAANQVSSVITVRLEDAYGALTSGITVILSSNSTAGRFYSNSAATTQITNVTISAGLSTTSFYYTDTAVGTSAITVGGSGVTSATTNFDISAHSQTVDHIAISPQGISIFSGGSLTYATLVFDQFGNSWDVTCDAQYSVDGATITGNIVSVDAVGNHMVASSYGGKTASTTLTVKAGSLDHFAITTPTSYTSGLPFTITVTAQDAQGNTVTSFNRTVSLSTSRGTISPTISGAFTNGVLTCSVTLTGNGPATITVNDDSSHVGISGTITFASGNAQTIQATKGNGEIIDLVIGGNITATQFSGKTLTSSQSSMETNLSFTLQGQSGTSGFTNITIPKSQIPYGSGPIVYIDNVAAQNQGFTKDNENYYVWFTVNFSTHQMTILFRSISSPTPTATPNPPSSMSLNVPVIGAIILIGVVLTGLLVKRKKSQTLKSSLKRKD
jgi:parallel beta-helix repeat protein